MDDMIWMKNKKFATFETEIDTLKQTLSKHVKENESLLATLNGFKTEFKQRESKSIIKEIVLENKNKELENIVSTSKGQCNKQIKGNNSFLRDNVNPARVKRDIDKIETINIELEHTLKNELRKLKGKNVIDTAVLKPNATTIAPGMFKLDLEPLAPKVLKNKDAYIVYIKHSREHADILQEIVEKARAIIPLDSNLDSAKDKKDKSEQNQPKTDKKRKRQEKE
ncbi:hypothetical protein Tco_0116010 [Tanacetum coccineum]